MSTPSQARSNVVGALMALAAFGLYAGHDAIIKALGSSYSTFQIVFFASLMTFPLTVFLMIADRTEGNLRPRNPGWMILRAVAAVVTGLAAFYAFSTLPLAQVYALLFAMPLLITVLSIPVLGERVRLRRWIAVVVGLVGVLVVLRPGSADLGLGHLAGIVAAVTGATASVIVRKIGHEERSMTLLLYPLVANFVVTAVALPFVYVPMPLLHIAGFVVVAVIGVVAMLLTISAYRRAEAVIVAPMQYSQLLWAVLWGLLFFDERPDWITGIGAAIIVGSGLYILMRESQEGASETRPVSGARIRPEGGSYIGLARLSPRTGRSGRSAK
jgi:drug/metabolite transporter (DMT)-like permease